MTDRPTDGPSGRRADGSTTVALAEPPDGQTIGPAVGTYRRVDGGQTVGTDRRADTGTDGAHIRATVHPSAGQGTDASAASDASEQPAVDTTDDEPWPLSVGLLVGLWGISLIATVMAANGQLGFAAWAGITSVLRYGVPAILELFEVVLLLLGYREGRRGRSPYPLWALATVVGGFAVYTNVTHSGPRAGLVYGAASTVTLLAWLIKLKLDLNHYQQLNDRRPPARPKFGVLWLVAPRIARKAWVIATRCRLTSTNDAVEHAEVWLDIYRDLRRAAVKRDLAKRTAWRAIKERCGVPVVELPRSVQVETVAVTVRPADDPTDGEPSAPVDGEQPTVTDGQASKPTGTDRRSTPSGEARRSTAQSAKPARRSRQSTVRLDWSPTVVANARLLRERYGDERPSVWQIRKETDWSNDRAKPAVEAYDAGADLLTNEPDNKEQAA